MTLPMITEIKRHKIRALKTLFTCLCYMCIGLQSAVIGVALLDLRVLAGSTLNQITLVVTGRAIGSASGSVVAGFIDSKVNYQLMLMLSLFLGAVVHIAIPLSRTLLLMSILCGISGFSCGVIDCYTNIFVLKLWAKECPPFLQALHFSYGIGSILVSLIVEPFLKEDNEDDENLINNSIVSNGSATNLNVTKVELRPEDIQLIIPYSIIAIITTSVGVLLLFSYIFHRETTDHPSRNAPVLKESKDGKKVEVIRNVNPYVRIFVILLTSLFLLFYIGLEKTVGTFIPAFGHDGPLQLPKKSGAIISAIYWITFTTFRLCAVFLSGVFGSFAILIFNVSITILACITLCVIETCEPVFWLSCALIGVGLSSTWGSMFGYMESQFPLNGKVVSCFTVGSCIGASFAPPIVGMLMAYDIRMFAYSSVTLSIMIAASFVVIYVVCKTILFTETRRSFRSSSTISQTKY